MRVKVENNKGLIVVYYLTNISRIRFYSDCIKVITLDNRVVIFNKHKSYHASDWNVLKQQLQSEVDFTVRTKHGKIDEVKIVDGTEFTTIHLEG